MEEIKEILLNDEKFLDDLFKIMNRKFGEAFDKSFMGKMIKEASEKKSDTSNN